MKKASSKSAICDAVHENSFITMEQEHFIPLAHQPWTMIKSEAWESLFG